MFYRHIPFLIKHSINHSGKGLKHSFISRCHKSKDPGDDIEVIKKSL